MYSRLHVRTFFQGFTFTDNRTPVRVKAWGDLACSDAPDKPREQPLLARHGGETYRARDSSQRYRPALIPNGPVLIRCRSLRNVGRRLKRPGAPLGSL